MQPPSRKRILYTFLAVLAVAGAYAAIATDTALQNTADISRLGPPGVLVVAVTGQGEELLGRVIDGVRQQRGDEGLAPFMHQVFGSNAFQAALVQIGQGDTLNSQTGGLSIFIDDASPPVCALWKPLGVVKSRSSRSVAISYHELMHCYEHAVEKGISPASALPAPQATIRYPDLAAVAQGQGFSPKEGQVLTRLYRDYVNECVADLRALSLAGEQGDYDAVAEGLRALREESRATGALVHDCLSVVEAAIEAGWGTRKQPVEAVKAMLAALPIRSADEFIALVDKDLLRAKLQREEAIWRQSAVSQE